jgi:hypothetical protein
MRSQDDFTRAFRALARPSHFSLLLQRKVTKRMQLPRSGLQLATCGSIAIATLGILPRVATADILSAALRVFRCSSAIEVEEIAL